MPDRILLGQLGAHGDCLYATILARQLRRDYPSACITWAISDRSSGLLANNPDIDEVWEIPVDRDSMPVIWSIFEREADRLYASASSIRCSSRSGQSFITPDLAQEVARRLYELIDDATVIFSTDLPMQLADPRSRYAGTLSLRETAHLTRHCTLFVGAGSGGTVAASSTASRPLPMILLLKKSTSMYASFAHDFEYFGVADRKVLELTDERPARIAQCIASACESGIDAAQIDSEGRIPIKFDHYFSMVRSGLLERMRYLDAAQSLLTTAGRYGWTADLIKFGTDDVAGRLPIDPSWCFARSRRVGERLRAELADAARRPSEPPRQRPIPAQLHHPRDDVPPTTAPRVR